MAIIRNSVYNKEAGVASYVIQLVLNSWQTLTNHLFDYIVTLGRKNWHHGCVPMFFAEGGCMVNWHVLVTWQRAPIWMAGIAGFCRGASKFIRCVNSQDSCNIKHTVQHTRVASGFIFFCAKRWGDWSLRERERMRLMKPTPEQRQKVGKHTNARTSLEQHI